MPVHVEKRGSKFAICEESGKVVGTSDSRAKAEASARMRNKAYAAKKKMQEAREHGDSRAFLEARALARHYDELAEARHATTFAWDPRLHPRNRLGEFVDVLNALKKAPRGSDVSVAGHDTVVKRSLTGKFHALTWDDKLQTMTTRATGSAEHVAREVLKDHDGYGSEQPAITTPRFRVFEPSHVTALASRGERKLVRHEQTDGGEVRPGLEGPFTYRSGWRGYYDPKEGRYLSMGDVYMPRGFDPESGTTLPSRRVEKRTR
jgi:hypothetical protein